MIGVKKNYPDVKDVRLIWHFLAFDKELDSTRSDEELENLKRDTIELIDSIESEERFEANPSNLCDWCEYKPVCKQWSHLYRIMDKSENEYMNDSGVKLVDRYAELKNRKKELIDEVDSELEKVEMALFSFASKEDVDVVFGSKGKVRIKESENIKFPLKNSRERKELEKLLKENGLWDKVDQLDTSALNKIITNKKIDPDLIKKIKRFVKLERSKRVYLSKL
jgi:putative RecB family exonuclease